jgi:chromosome segregation ATPase
VELSGYAAETLRIREVISYTFLSYNWLTANQQISDQDAKIKNLSAQITQAQSDLYQEKANTIGLNNKIALLEAELCVVKSERVELDQINKQLSEKNAANEIKYAELNDSNKEKPPRSLELNRFKRRVMDSQNELKSITVQGRKLLANSLEILTRLTDVLPQQSLVEGNDDQLLESDNNEFNLCAVNNSLSTSSNNSSPYRNRVSTLLTRESYVIASPIKSSNLFGLPNMGVISRMTSSATIDHYGVSESEIAQLINASAELDRSTMSILPGI